jgi:hypothetical protein
VITRVRSDARIPFLATIHVGNNLELRMTSSNDHQAQFSRRTLTRGIAWAAPTAVLSVAAPALAASRCGPGTLSWASNYTQESAAAGSGTAYTQTGRPIPFQVTSAATGSSVTFASTNLQASSAGIHIGPATTTPVPPSGHLGIDPAHRVMATFTFSEPVQNLRFAVKDIDRNNRLTSTEWVNVNASAADGTRLPAPGVPGANVIPFEAWFRAADGTGNADLADTTHWVTYTIAGPLTTINIFVDRPSREISEGGVALSDFAFDVAC